MKISAVIPSYNESGNIVRTIQEIFSAVKGADDSASVQVIVVDDHSCDGTYETLAGIKDPGVICIRLSRRSGSHTALRAGMKEAAGEAVLCISADGQDDPSCLKEMVDKYRNGANIVWAMRKDRKNEPWYISKPAELFYRVLFRLLGRDGNDIDLSRADFFLLGRIVVDAINACPERDTSLFGLIAWLGFKQDFVEYERRARLSGDSKWNFSSRLNLAKDWIIAFSGLPLKIASSAGIFISIAGAIGAVWIVINKLFFSALITGWASLMVVMLILGGIQLTMLGIAGEYLWRTLDESRKRPLYFIEKRSDLKI